MSPRSRFPGKDLDNPPGQLIHDVTLADYIERKQEAWEVVDAPKKETLDEAYLRGYDDGMAEGFQRGVLWMRGK